MILARQADDALAVPIGVAQSSQKEYDGDLGSVCSVLDALRRLGCCKREVAENNIAKRDPSPQLLVAFHMQRCMVFCDMFLAYEARLLQLVASAWFVGDRIG